MHTHIILYNIYICINTHVFCHQAKEVCWSTSGFRGTLCWTNSHWCRAMNVLMGKYCVGERLIHLIASVVPADLQQCTQGGGRWREFTNRHGDHFPRKMGRWMNQHQWRSKPSTIWGCYDKTSEMRPETAPWRLADALGEKSLVL